MAEQHEKREEQKETDAQRIAQDANEATLPDWLLQMLIMDVNEGLYELQITLTVGGHLVTGTAVPMETYLNGMGAILDEKWTAPGDVKPGEIFRQWLPKEEEKTEGEEKAVPLYINLREAFFFVPPQGFVPSDEKGVWWRGRLAAVDGWSFGLLRGGPTAGD